MKKTILIIAVISLSSCGLKFGHYTHSPGWAESVQPENEQEYALVDCENCDEID